MDLELENLYIHVFEVSHHKYLYDVNLNQIFSISGALFQFFKGKIGISKELLKEIQSLEKRGALREYRVLESVHPETKFIDSYMTSYLNTLLLQVTQCCNLRCDYCIYSGKYLNRSHSKKRMSFDTAKRGIDYLLQHSFDHKTLFLGFYGGEPLLEFELIEKCIDYIKLSASEKKIYINLTTNGTLLKKSIVDRLVELEVTILISLDGPKSIHDSARRYWKNNKGTFDTIKRNVSYIKKRYPKYFKEHVSFNCVLHKSGFKEVDEFLRTDEVFKDSVFLANFITEHYSKVKVEVEDNNFQDYRYEQFLFFLEKLGKLKNYKGSKLLNTSFDIVTELEKQLGNRKTLPSKFHRSGVCIPGLNKLFLTVDGKFYPCERVNENWNFTCIGTLEEGLDVSKIKKLTNLERFTSKKCRSCWVYSFCEICLSGVEGEKKIDVSRINDRCSSMRWTIEERLKDYCLLKVLGFDFREEGCYKEDNQDFIEEDRKLDYSLRSINIPVILMFSWFEGLQENDLAERIKNNLTQKGISTICLFDDELEICGGESKELDFWESGCSAEMKTIKLNHIIKSLEERGEEIVIISVPNGISKISPKLLNGLGFNVNIAIEAAYPDYVIVTIPFALYETKNDLMLLSEFVERKFGISVDCLNLSNKKICIEDSKRLEKMQYLTVRKELYDEIRDKFEEILSSIYSDEEIEKLVICMLEQLRLYSLKGEFI